MEQLVEVETGVTLCTRVEGEGVPVVLVMGIRLQLIHWPLEFCEVLRSRGLQLVRFDNRDTGRSTKLEAAGRPSVGQLAPVPWVAPPYSLDDMARDTLGLLDRLGLASAHVVGVSMGGMIAQLMALQAPERVRSLSLLMTTPGGIYLPRPRALLGLLRSREVDGPESYAEAFLSAQEALRGPGTAPFSEADRAAMFAASVEAWRRDPNPPQEAFLRQLAAVMSAPRRASALEQLVVPTRLIHGAQDPLLPPRASFDLASRLPHSDLHLIPGMGHGMPMSVRERVGALVADHVLRHEAGA
jgi:pimeloyl-ACP methyl ester carboxylesterase